MRCLTAGSLQGVTGPHWATAGLTTVGPLSRRDEPASPADFRPGRGSAPAHGYSECGGPSLGYAPDSKGEAAAPTRRRSPTTPAVTDHAGGHRPRQESWTVLAVTNHASSHRPRLRSRTVPAVTDHACGHGRVPLVTHSFRTWWCPQTNLLKTFHTGSGFSKVPLRLITAASK